MESIPKDLKEEALKISTSVVETLRYILDKMFPEFGVIEGKVSQK